MTYEEIYSQFYLKETDSSLFEQSKDDAYEKMCGWLHSIAGTPYVKKCFSKISFNDEINELTFTLKNSVDSDSDEEFVKELFAQGLVICWLRPQVDSMYNTLKCFGTKEEKPIFDNYKSNMERLKTLERDLKKFIRDYGYLNNNYIGE